MLRDAALQTKQGEKFQTMLEENKMPTHRALGTNDTNSEKADDEQGGKV